MSYERTMTFDCLHHNYILNLKQDHKKRPELSWCFLYLCCFCTQEAVHRHHETVGRMRHAGPAEMRS